MIKFFRQIRKDLVKKNKTGRYFKYAVGEIVLVMIGILLALQVNNWNETRKSSSKEQVILKSLKADFTNNLTLIEQEHKSTENAYYAAIKLKTLINPSAHEFSKQEVDSLISEMYDYIAFDPVSGSINEVINSGQLNIIKNKAIRNEISKWSSIINDAEDDIDITNGFAFNQLIPFLSKKGGISNRLISQTIMKRTKLKVIPASNFDADYNLLMRSLEFENMVNWHSINLVYLIDEYKFFVQPYLENIIRLIDSEITTD